jgi:hypothetical protein
MEVGENMTQEKYYSKKQKPSGTQASCLLPVSHPCEGKHIVNSPGASCRIQSRYESRRDFVLQPRVVVFQPTLGRKEIKFATLKRVVAVLHIA